MSENEPVCALVARTNTDAILVARFLQDQGIDATAVQDNSLPGAYLPEIIRPKVLVPPDQLDAASEFIARFESGQESPGTRADSSCYYCGAECAKDIKYVQSVAKSWISTAKTSNMRGLPRLPTFVT